MSPKTTKSIFGSIHLILALIAFGIVVGFYVLAQLFVSPKLIADRAHAVQSVIRSHEGDIVLNKTRSVRDELLVSGAIKNDQQFIHYFSDEKAKVEPFLLACDFVDPSVCLGPTVSVFFARNSERPARDSFNFAIVLRSDLSRPPTPLHLWEGVFAVIIGLAFWLLDRAISRKEKYLLGRLSAASAAFDRARLLFAEPRAGNDEFDTFGKSAEELVQILEEYKAKFERKTRLEQLGLTVGQVSHDLKAPLNEAENFLTSLPLLLKTASKEQLQEAIDSLVKRIRGGKDSLNQALQLTKYVTVAKEELKLGEVLKSVSSRAKGSAKLQRLSFALSATEEFLTLGDRMKLETAFLNLLENTADEKQNARVELTLSQTQSGHAKITYEDNGSGIPDEYLEKVFEPLVTYKSNGTGLGLSSTKEILAQHGGQIRALSNSGGAKFEILLPVLGGAHA